MKMQFFCLFTVFVIVSVSGEPIRGSLTKKNPRDFEDKAWNYVANINEENNGPNYLIPIQVVDVETQVVSGEKTTLQILFGESTCTRDGSVKVTEITSSNCQVISNGKRSLWEVVHIYKHWGDVQNIIRVSKIRDVEAAEVFTTTTGTPSTDSNDVDQEILMTPLTPVLY